ncbi:MAG: ABC transporter permease [Bacteroidales bacterium]|nr:ABC transporter permease [Bacteroidales bacterium]
MKHPLIQLTFAHIKEYVREPGALFWSFGFPILMALGLGVAFSGKKQIVHSVALVPSHIQSDTIVASRILYSEVEMGDTTLEKTFESEFGKTKYNFYITDWNNAELLMKRGMVSCILTEKNNAITFHSDPLNPEAELIGIQLDEYFKTGNPKTFRGDLEPLYTKGLRYIDFLIPGLLCLSTMMSVMWGVCYSLIERRSKKLLRRMIATPMKKYHLLLAMWASRLMILISDTIILLVFARLFFHIEIQGQIFALILLLIAGNFCFFGISILISSRTSNLQLGNGLISLVTTPMMVLSGIFFSYKNFPAWLIKGIKVLPLTELVDNMRAVFNEGAGLVQVWPGVVILTVTGIVFFFAGIRIYKWY